MNPSLGIRLGKRSQAGLAEIEAVLDLLPQAVVLVEQRTQRIYAANARAVELTAFTRQELYAQTLPTLVTTQTGADTRPTGSSTTAQAGDLNRRNGTTLEVEITPKPLPPRGDYTLVTIEPTSLRRGQGEEDQLHNLIWSGLYQLALAYEQPSVEAGLKTALEGARQLAQAEITSLYLVRNTGTTPLNKDAAARLVGRTAYLWNPTEILPGSVPPQDLMLLRSIRVWESGRRPPTSLHRLARASEFKYLATAPIGLPNHLAGLLVIGDRKEAAPRYILRITQFLANTFTNLLDAHAQQVLLLNRLEQQARQLRVLEAASSTIQDALLVFTPSLQTNQINQAAEVIFGYKNKEVQNQPIQNILIGSDAINSALFCAQKGEPTYHLEDVELLRRNGDPFQALVKVHPIVHEGQVESILVLVRDLSERAAFEEHSRQLAQNAEVGDAMAVFAHEVRNPINNISTGLQLMKMKLPEDNPLSERVLRMLQDCIRLDEMMKSMLAVTRTTDLRLDAMDFGGFLKNLTDRVNYRLTREGISVNVQIEPDLPLILGDARALEQVFNNLINNAAHAVHDQANAQLSLKVHADRSTPERVYLEASIADNGPGIPKDILDKIFQPFFTTKVDGNGLGLPLAKRIVTGHKGVINVTSIPGATIFHVVIPAADAESLAET